MLCCNRMLLVTMVLPVVCLASAETVTARFMRVSDSDVWIETIAGHHSSVVTTEPGPESLTSGVLWHYQTTGMLQQMVPIGFNAGYVLTGGYAGGAIMFQGVGGSGTPLWIHVPPGWPTGEVTCSVLAAATEDRFYSILQRTDNNTIMVSIHCGASAEPLWTWEPGDTGFVMPGYAYNPEPGRHYCTSDGSVLAVGGMKQGHPAIYFFHPDSSTPFSVWEDPAFSTQVSRTILTADGSKCIIRSGDELIRIDVESGTTESVYQLTSSILEFLGVSPDGSVVAYGILCPSIAVWDGSQYNKVVELPQDGYLTGAAAVAEDNTTVYFGIFEYTDFNHIKVIKYNLDAGEIDWIYGFPQSTGYYQDIVSWMECTPDGRWMVLSTWGAQIGGGPEVSVFDGLYSYGPVFSIDTPGSIASVDITDDGRYISAAGKSTHFNQWGSGNDIYFAEVTTTGVDPAHPPFNGCSLSILPNPSSGEFAASFMLPVPCDVTLELFDISGRTVFTSSHFLSESCESVLSVSTNLVPGVYFCRIIGAGVTDTQKLVIAR